MEEQLDDLFQNRKQASVVYADAPFKERQNGGDLGQIAVLLIQIGHGGIEDLADHLALFFKIEVELGHLIGQMLGFLLAESEDDDRVEIALDEQLDNFGDVGRS